MRRTCRPKKYALYRGRNPTGPFGCPTPGRCVRRASSSTLFVPGTWGHAVCVLPLARPEERIAIPLGQGSYPYGCLVDAAGKRLYVSLWNKAAVAVIDIDTKKVVGTFATEKHPTEMV